MSDKTLHASIVLGGAISATLKAAFGATTDGLKNIAREITQTSRLQKQLGGDLARFVAEGKQLSDTVEQYKKVTKQVETLTKAQKGLTEITDARRQGKALIATGMSNVTGGMAIFAPMIDAAHKAAEVQQAEQSLKAMGLQDDAISQLEAKIRATKGDYTDLAEAMHVAAEAQGIFRESGAKTVAEQISGAAAITPILLKMKNMAELSGHTMDDEQMNAALKIMEMRGGANDPKIAAREAAMINKIKVASGYKVQDTDILKTLQDAKVAGFNLSDEGLLHMEPLIAENSGAGVGLATTFNRGMGTQRGMTATAVKAMFDTGLWDRSKVNLTAGGTVKSFVGKDGPMFSQFRDAFTSDPVKFYAMLDERLKKLGYTDKQSAIVKQNLFGGTGGALAAQAAKLAPTIQRANSANAVALTPEQQQAQAAKMLTAQMDRMHASVNNLMISFAKSGAINKFTSLLNSAATVLDTIGKWGDRHPTAFAWIGDAVISAGVLKTGLGVLQIVFGGLLGPLKIASVLIKSGKDWEVFAKIFPRLATAITKGKDAFKALAFVWKNRKDAEILATLFPRLGKFLYGVGDAARWTKGKFSIFTAAAKSLGTVLITGLWNGLKRAALGFWNMAASLWGMIVPEGLAVGWIVAIVAAIALLILIVIEVVRHWELFKQHAITVWHQIVDTITDACTLINDAVHFRFAAAMADGKKLAKDFAADSIKTADAAKAAWGSVGDDIASAYNKARQFASGGGMPTPAAPAMPKPRGGGKPGTTVNNHYNITQQPGQSGKQLANQIGATQRGMLADSD